MPSKSKTKPAAPAAPPEKAAAPKKRKTTRVTAGTLNKAYTRRINSMSQFVYQRLRRMTSQFHISSKGVLTLAMLLESVGQQIIQRVVRSVTETGKRSIELQDMMAAVRELLPEQLMPIAVRRASNRIAFTHGFEAKLQELEQLYKKHPIKSRLLSRHKKEADVVVE